MRIDEVNTLIKRVEKLKGVLEAIKSNKLLLELLEKDELYDPTGISFRFFSDLCGIQMRYSAADIVTYFHLATDEVARELLKIGFAPTLGVNKDGEGCLVYNLD